MIAVLAAAGRWLIDRPERLLLFVLIPLAGALWLNLGLARSQRDIARSINAGVAGEIRRINGWGERVAIDPQSLPQRVRVLGDTIATVRTVSARLTREAEEDRQRVEARYVAIAEEASDEQNRLAADYRSRVAVFVRGQRAAAGGDPGHTDGAGLPGAAAMPGGAVPQAGFAIVSVTDLDRTAAAFAQLNALIDYASGVASAATPVPVDR